MDHSSIIDSKISIECKVNYYDENNIKKKRTVVEDELDSLCDKLKK